MINKEIVKLLKGYKSGEIDEETIINKLKNLSFESLEFARIDHHRALRKSFPEVIFCKGKTSEQISKIAKKIVENGNNLLATKATPENYKKVKSVIPGAIYNKLGKLITYEIRKQRRSSKKNIVVVSAGTSDIPIAEEAALTAYMMGNKVKKIYDVGVAGIHRLMNYMDTIKKASVIIVVAGMEGALASVIGGLVDIPVIAVPTSVGYGASFSGIAALLGMLNSCSAGITVVNIDNGFGAGYAAGLILKA
jgi:NCAIR mutase (PurE)-related protein